MPGRSARTEGCSCLLGVGIEGVSPKPEQEMAWVVACGVHHSGRV